MLNSRSVELLRPDVCANCKVFLTSCEKAGLHVKITSTLRDAEYQASLYAQGRTTAGQIVTNAKTPSFHGAGLAFDVCQNIAGKEWETDFFSKCAKIGKEMGFEWGGDWKEFPDKPHFQWSYGGKYKSKMILSGVIPPLMPLWKGEDEMIVSETTVKIGENQIPAKLIDGITYVPLRTIVDTIKTALNVTWSKEDGAGVEMK